MSFVLDSATLDRRVAVQTRDTDKTTHGQRVATWTEAFKAWARIDQMQGRELEAAQAINVEVTHNVVMRYRPTVTPAQRVVYQGRIFNVLAVLDPETAHVALHLLCSEGLTEG